MDGRLERIRVFVADDHPLYREGVIRAIKERPDFELVGSSGDGHETLDRIRELEPDVALVDLRLPGLDAIKIVKAIERDDASIRVVVISAATDAPIIYEAISAGAWGYVSKDAGRRELCDALARAGRGSMVLSLPLQMELVGHIRGRNPPDDATLTPRERQILAFIADGASAPQIAKELYLGTTTVKSHMANLYGKLGVSDRAAAVAEAMRRGLLE